MLKRHLHDLYECFLCLILSASLALNVAEGFLLPERLCGTWLPGLLLSAGVIFVCAVVSWSDTLRKFVLIGCAVLVSASLTSCIILRIPLGETSDPERNIALWFLIVIGCTLFIWLCGRTRIGTWILAVIGILLHCGTAVLEFPFSLPALVLYLACSGLLLALRGTERNGAVFPASAKLILFQLLVGLTAFAFAAILCFAVLMPFHLPTVDLRLFTELVSPDILEQAGLIDNTVTLPEEGDSSGAVGAVSGENASPESADASAGLADDMPTDDGGGITRYLNQVSVQNRFLIGMLLIDLTLILLVFRRPLCLLKLLGRKPDEQLHLLYLLILNEFVLLGLPGQGSDTPAEYAKRIKSQTDGFHVSSSDWRSLTERYVRFCYAGKQADRACIADFRRFYLSLPNLLLWRLRKRFRKNRKHKV